MPQTRRNKKNGGGWAQGPALSPEQYYLSEYKAYTDCYPMSRPGSIQSNPNPDLAQISMAGGRSRTRKSRQNKRNSKTAKVGGSTCKEYFLTRGGKRQLGGCGCMMKGGVYGQCPFAKNSFNCPYKQGGKRNTKRNNKKLIKGGRYMVDTASSIGGDGPNVAPIISSFPCEGYKPMPINPHQPDQLVSAPESDVHFAGLSPGAVLKGGKRSDKKRSDKKRSTKKQKRNDRKQNGGNHPLAYTAPRAGFSFFPNIAQGQTLNPGQIPYEVVVPTDGSDSASCGKSCGDAMVEINKA